MKLTLNKGQKLWFTSDTHYNHANICSATTQWKDPVTCREFKTLEYMNATLVNNINEFVGQDDTLFHLGDWSFGGFEQIELFRNQIVCKNTFQLQVGIIWLEGQFTYMDMFTLNHEYELVKVR